MKHLIVVVGALAMVWAPLSASAHTPRHHHRTHHRHVARPVAPPVQDNYYGATALKRIPSLDPPECDSPNVVSVENCRISSNGRR